MSGLVERKYLLPFILITSLFFMWGFARSILDVLNKHFQETLDISISCSAFIQGVTYLGYFLMALPAGIMITRLGYRRGVTSGLGIFALGCFLFIPGERMISFGMFLVALFIIGCGLVILETAANPYAAELGVPATAASRLNLSQSFNGLGCILGPVTIGSFLFTDPDAGVALPYGIMGVFVLIVALIFSRVSLPEIRESVDSGDSCNTGIATNLKKLLTSKHFLMGMVTLFCYEVAEISINSLFINYATSGGVISKQSATLMLSFGALGLFMVARVFGSWVMSRVSAALTLLFCASGAALCSLLVTLDAGWLSRGALFGCYAFEAIMFPTVFALTISRVSGNVKMASSLLMMTPLGGAVGTLLMGLMADSVSLPAAFIVPAVGYAVVLTYALHIKSLTNLADNE